VVEVLTGLHFTKRLHARRILREDKARLIIAQADAVSQILKGGVGITERPETVKDHSEVAYSLVDVRLYLSPLEQDEIVGETLQVSIRTTRDFEVALDTRIAL
jgi:hypothetical protein